MPGPSRDPDARTTTPARPAPTPAPSAPVGIARDVTPSPLFPTFSIEKALAPAPSRPVAQAQQGYSQTDRSAEVPAEVGVELAERAGDRMTSRSPWMAQATGDRANNLLFQNRADLANRIAEARTSGNQQEIAYLTNLINQSNDPVFKQEYLGMLASNAPLTPEQQLERTRNAANPRRIEREYVQYLDMNGLKDSEEEYQNWLKIKAGDRPATPTPSEAPTARTVTEPTVEVPATLPDDGNLPNAGQEPQGPTPVVEEKNGEPRKGFDWGKVLELAKAGGQGLVDILGSGLTGYARALRGEGFNYEENTASGRRQKQKREREETERGQAFEQQIRELDRTLTREENRLDREHTANMAKAQTEAEKASEVQRYQQQMAMLEQEHRNNMELARLQAQTAQGLAGGGASWRVPIVASAPIAPQGGSQQ